MKKLIIITSNPVSSGSEIFKKLFELALANEKPLIASFKQMPVKWDPVIGFHNPGKTQGIEMDNGSVIEAAEGLLENRGKGLTPMNLTYDRTYEDWDIKDLDPVEIMKQENDRKTKDNLKAMKRYHNGKGRK